MSLNIASVEFSEVKDALKSYLSTKSGFTDYNFEGSGLSYIIDALAYMIHYNGYYLNMSVNECFLDYAQLRKNVNALARMLNYNPRRPTGAQTIVTIAVESGAEPSDPSVIITIPKYTDFASSGDVFYSTEQYQLTSENGYSFSGAILRQGIKRTTTVTSNGLADQSIIIENTKIDNDTLEVYVDGTLWTKQNNLTVLTDESQCYFVELTDDNYVKIVFGDGIIGAKPGIGETIEIIYTETAGVDSNEYDSFVINDIVQDQYGNLYDSGNIVVTVTSSATGGADYESISSIKANAPRFYEAQGRLVTVNDYLSYLSQHQLVDDVNVWGGEDDLPTPIYGKVLICVKPVTGSALSSADEEILRSYIEDKSMLTIIQEFRDPTYFYIDIAGTVYYNQQYADELNTVRDDVEQEISDFFAEIDTFDSIFKSARFVTALVNLTKIDNVNLTFSPFFYFSKIATGNYYWVLDNSIVAGTISCNIVNGSIDEGFYDDGSGNILTRKSGNAIIGEVDYTSGTIEIFPNYSISATEPTNGFQVYFDVTNDDLYYKRNRIVECGTLTLTYTRNVD